MTGLDTPVTNLTFALTIPPSWFEFDLRPSSRDQTIRQAVEERLRDVPQLWGRRADIIRYVRGVARDAWDNGARFCATFVEPAAAGVLMGSLTLTILPPIKPIGRSTVADLLRQAESEPVNRARGEWRLTEPVQLAGAGRAVRQWGVQALAPRDMAGNTLFVFTHTFIPTDNAVVLVACASPAADVADPLLELFATVSDSLVLTAPDGDNQVDSADQVDTASGNSADHGLGPDHG